MFKRALALSIVLCALSQQAEAEVFYLRDKSEIAGTILNFNEDKFVILRQGGGRQVINRGDVEKIVFSTEAPGEIVQGDEAREGSPQSDPNFSSPIKTFMFWKKSAIKGDLAGMAECFVSPSRGDQLAQLNNFSPKKVKEMRKQTKRTDFALGEPLYDGDRAYLSVSRSTKKSKSSSIIQFQKEGESWKMIPE